LLTVALDISPVMRWPVDENVRLPDARDTFPEASIVARVVPLVARLSVVVVDPVRTKPLVPALMMLDIFRLR
jgi:hypothetical protein